MRKTQTKKDFLADRLGSEGVFDEFYLGYLRNFEKKMQDILDQTNLEIENVNEMKKSILSYMKECLVELGISTLIHDLHEQQEKDIFLCEDSEEGYRKYCAYLLKEGGQKILYQYPVIKYLMELKLHTVENMLRDVMANLETDAHLIAKEFGVDVSVLKNIELGKGDTHNHGKMVAVITFQSGEKVVYKPRSLKPERAYAHLCEWLNQYEESYQLKWAKMIDKETFGWQEFISRKECSTEQEVKAYFHRMGKNMALFYVLNTSDLHAENILPSGEYPYFVDLETLCTAQKRVSKDNNQDERTEFSDVIQRRIAHSVFSTSILPQVFATKMFDIDISGLGARPGQESKKLKYMALCEKGTTQIHFEERGYVTGEMDNSVILCGQKVDYVKYVEEIENGFASAYRILLERKEELKEEINKKLSNGFYRQVLRGTYVYGRFLTASTNPKYLIGQKERENLLCLIDSNQSVKGKEEVRQMMEHDVPYFMAEYDSTALYTIDSIVESHFFERSLKEQISENINGLKEQDLTQQLCFIRNGVMLSKRNIMREEYDISKKEKLVRFVSGSSVETALEAIVKRISDYAIWNQDNTSCIFIEPNLGERAAMGVIMDNLYHYIGTIWFLFAYAEYTGKEKDMRLANASLKGLACIYPEKNYIKSTAAFSGYFSYIYLYCNLYQLTGDFVYKEKYLSLLRQISEYDPAQEASIDVMTGLSGAVLILAHMEEKGSTDIGKKLLAAYADLLSQKVDAQTELLTGFSHGMAGMALALQAAGDVLGKTEYRLKSKRLQQKEDDFFSEKENNWLDLREKGEHCEMFWCHGAPGILLARSYEKKNKKYFSKYNQIMRDIEECIEKGKMNDSMCHGNVGNLDILLAISGNIEDNALQKRVKNLSQKLAEKILKNGVEYGIPQMNGLVSFMLGLSGIGYGFLRCLDSSLPCVLSLEIHGGKKNGRLSA